MYIYCNLLTEATRSDFNELRNYHDAIFTKCLI